ncbi:MAG: hypothetical protein ABIR38_05675 [Chthoniobacterales bacterium]
MKTAACLALMVFAWFAYARSKAPISYPPGVLIADDPIQTDATPNDVPFDQGQFHLQPLAHFSCDARVLHRKIYRYDRSASLVPVDLAIGWGRMSDQAVLDRLTISQSARFFWYEYQEQPPIPSEEIISHATNLHLIPATNVIAGRCRSLRTGELVHLSGLLVEARSTEYGTWRSSLSRTDSGNGACELLWVEELTTLSH